LLLEAWAAVDTAAQDFFELLTYTDSVNPLCGYGEQMKSNVSRIILTSFVGLTVLAFSSNLAAEADAAKVFKTNCVLCHSADGSGDSPTGKALKAKDLRSDEVQKSSDADLTAAIAKGKGKMPAFGSKLSPDVVQSLVAYIRALAKK
jgi:mono/diheme cytochrome c family protein